jgi:NADPH:quinone reductase-like Zn-dependent oxidoreductase
MVMGITGGRGADLIYDPVCGKAGEEAMGCIAMEGRFHDHLMELYRDGRIRSLTTRTIGFEAVPAALQALPSSTQIGRTVVVYWKP